MYERSDYEHERIRSPESFRILHADREIPFMTRVLSNKLRFGEKFNGKPLYRGQKPRPRTFINIEIPEYESSEVSEDVESRSISGGQWQRIALARSFMKIKEADLLILDEPSSALDPQAEYEVFKSIMELRKNKTTIYIVSIYVVSG